MIFLPKVIKLSKVLILILLLIFTSGVFVGTLSILNSIDSVNSELYGESENIMVVTNSGDNTPYTSYVPNIYDITLNQIDGVEAVSPEILLPVVFNDYSTFVRGVEFTRIFNVSNINILTENIDLSNIKDHEIIISNTLYERIDIDINQTIELKSTLNDHEKLAKVIGIYESDDLSAPQFLAPNVFAYDLSLLSSRGSIGGYTHYRVKYNPEIISQSEIYEILNTNYELAFRLLVNNVSNYAEKWSISIYDRNDNLVSRDSNFGEIYETKLPLGSYRIFYEFEDVRKEDEIFINQSREVELHLNRYVFEIDLETQINSVPSPVRGEVQGLKNTYDNQSSNFVTNNNGRIKLFISSGMKRFNFILNNKIIEKTLYINSSRSIFYNFDTELQFTKIIGFSNNSIVNQDNLNLTLNSSLEPWERLTLNGNNLSYSSNLLLLSNLNPGINQITWTDTRGVLPNQSIIFNFTSSLNNFKTDFSPNSHFNPNSIIEINTTGIIPQTFKLISSGEILNISENSLSITLTNTIGTYNLELEALNYKFDKVYWSIPIYIENTNYTAGLLTSISEPIFSPGDEISFWNSEEVTNISIDGTSVSYSHNKLRLPFSLNSGDYQLLIETENKVNVIQIQIRENMQFTNNEFQGGDSQKDLTSTPTKDTSHNKVVFSFFNVTIGEFIKGYYELQLIHKVFSLNISYYISHNETVYIPKGEYEYIIRISDYQKSLTLSNPNGTIFVETDPILIDFQVNLVNQSPNVNSITLSNIYVENEIRTISDVSTGIHEINKFPAGNLNFQINYVSNKKYNILREIYRNDTLTTIYIENIKENFDIDYSKFVNSNIHVNVNSADQATNSNKSVLGLSNLLIIAESIIIFLLLIISSAGVYISYIYQNRNEVKILMSIGMSDVQILYSMLKQAIILSPFISYIGGLFGLKITEYLFRVNPTTIFGINFFPEINMMIWMTNFVVNFVLLIFGGYFGVVYTKYLLLREK